jgi:uncharacterized protein (DUF488 family)
MNQPLLFTIGHSTRTPEEFVELLTANEITAIADVRSQPYSRHMPHFNRESLQTLLKECGITYVFLGEELGARRNESCCYVDGQAKYDLIARTPAFQSGLNRIRMGMKLFSIALMCAEKDPITCHRTILVARALRFECEIRHVVSSNYVESHSEAEQRLLRKWNLNGPDLFASPEDLLERAYQLQAEEIAYVDQELAAPAKDAINYD